MNAAHITYLARSISGLTAFELAAAIRYWQKNQHLDSADTILAMHVDEQRRRLAVSLGLCRYAGTAWSHVRREAGTLMGLGLVPRTREIAP
jgi:hypothetical protein